METRIELRHATFDEILRPIRQDLAAGAEHADAFVPLMKGNAYRLIARVNYQTQRVFILRILTHAEYTEGRWKE